MYLSQGTSASSSSGLNPVLTLELVMIFCITVKAPRFCTQGQNRQGSSVNRN
jgi:hypothetical protein